MSSSVESRAWIDKSSGQPFSPGRVAVLFGISILLLMLTRLPFVPQYLYSFDEVNLTLALHQFDPTRSQPQPPGYPFFVGEERLFAPLLGTPERTFGLLASVISGLALGVMYLLGRRMFSPTVGLVAAILLFANPVFWFSSLTSPLRPHLALISLLVAYTCWRAMSGERGYLYAASLALGLGSGFRPELLAGLFPLWAWTAWHYRNRAVELIRATVLLAISCLLWIGVLVIAAGGVRHLTQAFSEYLFVQTQQTSMLANAQGGSWLRWVGRGLLWNGLGVLSWIWAVPFAWIHRRSLWERKQLLIFLGAWFLPPFLFNLSVHIAEPGHALSTIPFLCLAGAFCLEAMGQSLRHRLPELKEGMALLIGIALIANLLFFFGEFPLPKRASTAGFHGWQSLTDAVLFGTYDTSYARVRWVDQMMELGFAQIQNLKSSAHGPVFIVWGRDGEPVWRKICYYLPSEKVWVLDEPGQLATTAAAAQLWVGSGKPTKLTGAVPIRVPLPKGARLIWVVGSASADSLRQAVPLQNAAPLYYTDLPAEASTFRWGSFEFAPQ